MGTSLLLAPSNIPPKMDIFLPMFPLSGQQLLKVKAAKAALKDPAREKPKLLNIYHSLYIEHQSMVTLSCASIATLQNNANHTLYK